MTDNWPFQRQFNRSYSYRRRRIVRRRLSVRGEGVNVGTANRIRDAMNAGYRKVLSRDEHVPTGALVRVERITGLDDHDIARAVGIPVAQLGKRTVWTRAKRERFNEIVDLAHRLEETFEAESVSRWLNSPSRDLRGRQPIELLRAGRVDEVDAALEALDAGVYI